MDLNVEQGTEEWHKARLGKVTASSLYKVLAKTKNGYGIDRQNYLLQLILERVRQEKTDSYTSADMLWGIEQEPFARAAYEAAKEVMVEEVGFIQHPTIEMAGASPDGVVAPNGIIEIKCPSSKTALECWLSNSLVDKKHFAQVQWTMCCTNSQWCDYIVFDPRLPKDAQLFIHRVERDDEWIKQAEKEVIKFLEEVEANIDLFNQVTAGKLIES